MGIRSCRIIRLKNNHAKWTSPSDEKTRWCLKENYFDDKASAVLSELLFAWSSKACVHSWCKVSCRAKIWLVCSIMMKTTVPIPRLWQAEQWSPVYMKTAQTFARLEEQTELSFLCLFSFSPTAMWKSWLNNGVLWSSYNHPSWQMMPIWLFLPVKLS